MNNKANIQNLVSRVADRLALRSDSSALFAEKKARPLAVEALEPRILFSVSPTPVEPAPAEAPAAQEAQAPADSDAAADPAPAAEAPAEVTAVAAPPEATVPAPEGAADQGDTAVALTDAELSSLADAAAGIWASSGTDAAQGDALADATYQIADLSGIGANILGATEGNVITIDDDAAGRGWFVDGTPEDNSEFSLDGSATTRSASAGVDLLSVLLHEQGHILGLLDVYGSENAGDIMNGVFVEGERRSLTEGQADGATPGSLEGVHYAVVTEDLESGLGDITVTGDFTHTTFSPYGSGGSGGMIDTVFGNGGSAGDVGTIAVNAGDTFQIVSFDIALTSDDGTADPNNGGVTDTLTITGKVDGGPDVVIPLTNLDTSGGYVTLDTADELSDFAGIDLTSLEFALPAAGSNTADFIYIDNFAYDTGAAAPTAAVVYELTVDGGEIGGTLTFDSSVAPTSIDGGTGNRTYTHATAALPDFSFTRDGSTAEFDQTDDVFELFLITDASFTPLFLKIDIDDTGGTGDFFFTEGAGLDLTAGTGNFSGEVQAGGINVTGATLAPAAPTPAGALITGVTIEDVSSEFTGDGRLAVNLVGASATGAGGDGTGLTAGDHSLVVGDQWLTQNSGDPAPSVVFDLGAVYTIDSFSVWNYNEHATNDFGIKRGVQDLTINYGETTGLGMALTEVTSLDQAPLSANNPGTDYNNGSHGFAPFDARYIEFDINSNYGDGNFYGLAEVQFFGTLVPTVGGPAQWDVTVGSGNWDDGSSWIGGVVPTFDAGDTAMVWYDNHLAAEDVLGVDEPWNLNPAVHTFGVELNSTVTLGTIVAGHDVPGSPISESGEANHWDNENYLSHFYGTGKVIWDNNGAGALFDQSEMDFRDPFRAEWSIDMELADDLMMDIHTQRDRRLSSTITESGGSHELEIWHNGGTDNELYVSGANANTYSGGTTIDGDAYVVLEKDGALGAGDVTILDAAAQLKITNDGAEDRIGDSAGVFLVAGSTLILDSGVDETVGALYFDGVQQDGGTWGRTGLTGVDHNTDFITGDGVLTVPIDLTRSFTDSDQLNLTGRDVLAAVNLWEPDRVGDGQSTVGVIQGVDFDDIDSTTQDNGVPIALTSGEAGATLAISPIGGNTGREFPVGGTFTPPSADNTEAEKLPSGQYFQNGDSTTLTFDFGAGRANTEVEVQIVGGGVWNRTDRWGILTASVDGEDKGILEDRGTPDLLTFSASTDASGNLAIDVVQTPGGSGSDRQWNILGGITVTAEEAPAAPAPIITGETATARSEFFGSEPWGRPAARAVNDVGMTGEGATGVHQTSGFETGWQVGQPGDIEHWFKVDLGEIYDVENMYVWNGLPGIPSWGAKTVDIYYATTDSGNNTHEDLTDFNTTGWNTWGTVDDLAQYVSGSYTPTDTIALNVNARYIVLNVTAAHSGINNTSIAELQFSGTVPVTSAPIIPLTGASSTAGAAASGTPASKVTDGSGMTGELADGTHSGSNSSDAWFNGGAPDEWFKVDLGGLYDVEEMYVWNGQPGNGVDDRGVGSADIYYSTNVNATGASIPTNGASSGDWILITSETFAKKPSDTADYGPTDVFDLGVQARVIGLDLTQGFGGNGGNSLAELQFTGTLVPAIGSPPVAVDDILTAISEDAGATDITGTVGDANSGVLGNDSDPDSDPLTIAAIDDSGITAGTLALNTGVLTYDPNGEFEFLAAGETATQTFTYAIDDGNGNTDTATATITITGENDAPVLGVALITGVTATAEASSGTRVPDNVVSGKGIISGEGATGLHTGDDPEDGWLAADGLPNWFRVDLGDLYEVDTMYVWNGESGVPTRGVETADIYYSTNVNADASDFGSGDWTLLTAGQTFNDIGAPFPADGPSADFLPTDAFAFNNVQARIVALNITDHFTQTGGALNELQFTGTLVSETVLPETNAALEASGTLTVTDVDTTDEVTAAVDSVAVTAGDDNGILNATLLDMMTVGANPVIANGATTGTINWDFDSVPETFDYLAVNESLELTYTLSATDGSAATTGIVTWETPTSVFTSGDATVLTDGTLITAESYGDGPGLGDYTVNGVEFTGVEMRANFDNDSSGGMGQGWQYINWGTSLSGTTPPGPHTDFAGLLDGTSFSGVASTTITLDDLEIGKTYTAQFFIGDLREAANDGNPDGRYLDGGYQIIGVGAGNISSDAAHIMPIHSFVGTWVADATTQDFTITNTGGAKTPRALLNAAQWREVPAAVGQTTEQTVVITINGTNDVPIANDDDDSAVGFTTAEDTAFTTGNVLTNDTDLDTSDVLSVVSIDVTGTAGVVTDNNDGTFDYDPNGAFNSLVTGDTATDTFTYTISDGNGGMDTATVTVTITGASITIVDDVLTIGEESGRDDRVTISSDGTNLRIRDAAGTVVAGAGGTQVDANTVDIALSSFEDIVFEAKDADDIVTIGDMTGFDGSLTVLGGDGFDSVVVANGASVALGTDENLVVAAEQFTARLDSEVSVMGTGSITIDGTGGGATGFNGVFLQRSSFSSMAGDITINGQGGSLTGNNDGVLLKNGTTISTTMGGSVSITGVGGGTAANNDGISILDSSDISVLGAGTITLTGTGAGTNDSFGVQLAAGTEVTSEDGAITIAGDGGGTGTRSSGVYTNGSTVETTGGAISITGTGSVGASGRDGMGLNLVKSTVTAGGTGTGTVTLAGTGGDGTHGNVGVSVGAQTKVTAGGDVTVTGTSGNGTGIQNRGIEFLSGSAVSGGGALTIMGTSVAAGATNSNEGVYAITANLGSTGAGVVTITGVANGTGSKNAGVGLTRTSVTSDGNISISGTGTTNSTNGRNNDGVTLNKGTLTTDGTLTLVGTGGTGKDNNRGIYGISSNLSAGMLDIRGTANVGTMGRGNSGVSFVSTALSDVGTIMGTGGGGTRPGNFGVYLQKVTSGLAVGDITGVATDPEEETGGNYFPVTNILPALLLAAGADRRRKEQFSGLIAKLGESTASEGEVEIYHESDGIIGLEPVLATVASLVAAGIDVPEAAGETRQILVLTGNDDSVSGVFAQLGASRELVSISPLESGLALSAADLMLSLNGGGQSEWSQSPRGTTPVASPSFSDAFGIE